MSDLTPQLEKMMENAKRVTLSRMEKDAMRTHVEEFVRANPKRGGMIPSPWVAGRFLMMAHKPVAFALVLLLIVGGGTAYAAEGALPGDALYPIKVNVVEEAVAAVQVSDTAKAQWAAQRAERRLTEATTLTDSGRMTDEKQAEIQERFDHLAQAVEEHTKHVEETKGPRIAAAVLADFEAKLRGHERALARAENVRPAGAARALSAEVKIVAPMKAVAPAIMATMPAATSTEDTAEYVETGSARNEEDEDIGPPDIEVETAASLVKTVHARLKKLEQLRLGVELKERNHENDADK